MRTLILTALAPLLLAQPDTPRPFLIEPDHHPRVSLSWPAAAGRTTQLAATRPYLGPNDRTPLGKNISAYVGVGGNRVDLGLADPRSMSIRVGFFKIDKSAPFFDDLADGSAITIVLTGVRFTRPASPRPDTLLHHLKFDDPKSVLGCATDPIVFAAFNTFDADEDLGGRAVKRNSRPGILSDKSSGADASVTAEADGSVTLRARIPYRLFKHPDDAWLRANPGDFTEPIHFHLEFECVPADSDSPREPVTRPPS